MMLVLGFLLAFRTQAVFSFNFVQFSNVVEQCSQFSVNFSGPGQTPMPLTLTIVPFNSQPVYIPIPESSWNATSLLGVAFTFLPLPAKTLFIASLDDAEGHTAGSVSDVIQVQNSTDTSCLASKAQDFHRMSEFRLENNMLSQCSSFAVAFNTTTVRTTPSIRGFTPRGNSFNVTQNNGTSHKGKAEYVMNAFHGSQVVLLIDDESGNQETTGLTTVGGDSTSKSDCFANSQSHESTSSSSSNKTNSSNSLSLSSQTKIIVAAVCGGVVLSIGGLMAYLVRRRRLQKKLQSNRNPDIEVQSPESSYGVIFSSLAPSMSLVESRMSVFRTSASQKGNTKSLEPIIETGPDHTDSGAYSFTPFILLEKPNERPNPSVPLPSSPRFESEVHSRASTNLTRQSFSVSDLNIEPKSLSTFSLGLVSISSRSSRFAAPARRDSDDIIEGLSSRLEHIQRVPES